LIYTSKNIMRLFLTFLTVVLLTIHANLANSVHSGALNSINTADNRNSESSEFEQSLSDEPSEKFSMDVSSEAALSVYERDLKAQTELAVSDCDKITGYWEQTWDEKAIRSTSTNSCVWHLSFSGWNTIKLALANAKPIVAGGKNFLTLGGSNEKVPANGVWTQGHVTRAISDLWRVVDKKYDGIAFDIEHVEGSSEVDFSALFAATKKKNLIVLVTVSHSAPYKSRTGDVGYQVDRYGKYTKYLQEHQPSTTFNGKSLMETLLADDNIDYMSPQVYTTGYETSPDTKDYSSRNGLAWSKWAEHKSNWKFVPSVPNNSQYQKVVNAFSNLSVYGTIQWQAYSTQVAVQSSEGDFDKENFEEEEEQGLAVGSPEAALRSLNVYKRDFKAQNELAVSGCEKITGYWEQTWDTKAVRSTSTNSCVWHFSFSGWNTIKLALANAKPIIVGGKNFLTLGGSNEKKPANGVWTQAHVKQAIDDLDKVVEKKYTGIAFDIEHVEGPSKVDFSGLFKATKDKDLEVLVTVSHSAPYKSRTGDVGYHIDGNGEYTKYLQERPLQKCKNGNTYNCTTFNGKSLMKTLLADPNIDYMSPQVYTTGYETSPDTKDYSSRTGIAWSKWAEHKSNWKFVPSVPNNSQYQKVVDAFSNISVYGTIQWQAYSTQVAVSSAEKGYLMPEKQLNDYQKVVDIVHDSKCKSGYHQSDITVIAGHYKQTIVCVKGPKKCHSRRYRKRIYKEFGCTKHATKCQWHAQCVLQKCPRGQKLYSHKVRNRNKIAAKCIPRKG